MKRLKIVIPFLIIATITSLFLLIWFTKQSAKLDIKQMETIYNNAANAVMDSQNITMDIFEHQEMDAYTNTFTQTRECAVNYNGFGCDNATISIDETMTVGSHKAEIHEIYANNTAYVTINSWSFYGPTSRQEFEQKILPPVLLNFAHYQNITCENIDGEYVFQFANATEIEPWMSVKDIRLKSANGIATVSQNGRLSKSTYNVEYTKGDLTYRLSVTVKLLEQSPIVPIPQNLADFTPIDFTDAPILFEKVSGYFTQAANVKTSYEDSTYFEAFGDRRTKNVAMEIRNSSGFSANVDTKILVTNDSRSGPITTFHQTETFKNGIYSVKKDDFEAQNETFTAENMQNYCQNILVGTIILPQHIISCSETHETGLIKITFQASESFAKQIGANACQTLYQDAKLLDKISENNKTDVMNGYLFLDSTTGLPVEAGLSYEGTYVADGITYQLKFSASQKYQLSE